MCLPLGRPLVLDEYVWIIEYAQVMTCKLVAKRRAFTWIEPLAAICGTCRHSASSPHRRHKKGEMARRNATTVAVGPIRKRTHRSFWYASVSHTSKGRLICERKATASSTSPTSDSRAPRPVYVGLELLVARFIRFRFICHDERRAFETEHELVANGNGVCRFKTDQNGRLFPGSGLAKHRGI